MKYSLIKPINPNYSVTEQLLTNRGIKREDIPHYLNTTDDDINSYLKFGEDILKRAAAALITTIKLERNATIIIDADCDGFTSAAILYNYLHDLFPYWVENHLHYRLHSAKQHGLNDHVDEILDCLNGQPELVIIPDAGTNDAEECRKLQENDCPVIILDHHIQDVENPYAIIINNQTSDYPNKDLSGAGVTWQFCRYLDALLGQDKANKYLDLVAVGLVADMMSLLSYETKRLVEIGLNNDNIINPFLVYLIDKNQYKIKEKVTPTAVAFFIAPFINAIVRSGTDEEKDIIFKSMLNRFAFVLIPSNKRGHKQGEMEKIVEQAMRVATNVKARQTRIQDQNMDLLINKIESENLLAHKVILLLMQPGQIDKNIAGLFANKLMAIYQRPCCILTRVEETNPDIPPWEDQPQKQVSYQGSARGCDFVGVTEFKSICEASGQIMYASGHEGAFGLGILEENIPAYLAATDELLKDMQDEAVYQVDYIWTEKDIQPDAVIEIAKLKNLWGKDLPECKIALEHIKVTPEMVAVYRKSTNTLKIGFNDVSCVMFNAKDVECEKFQDNNTGYIEVNFIVECELNEWMGNIYPQFQIKNYEIIDSQKYFF